ncbi:MAG: phage portal protein [Methanobrevibacter sp.]|nr:phage portal protein [Methanosphaera sp.]MBR0369143.1 phage portal protein [Methanobrevibacter sp.]
MRDKLRGILPVVRKPEYNSNFSEFVSNYGWIFSSANKNEGDYRLYELAENNVYVYRSIEVISDTLLINGFKINNPDDERVNFERTNYLYNLFNNPQGYSSELSYAMFHKQYVKSYELTGDSFIEVNYENFNWDNDDYYKVINGFNFVPGDLLRWFEDTGQWGYRTQPSIRYEPDELIHIYDPQIKLKDLKWGVSKLEKIRLPIYMMFKGLTHNQELLDNDGLDPRAILAFDKEISNETFEAELERLSEMSKHRKKGGTLAVKGASFQSSSVTNQDMDFISLMNLSRDMILSAYGVQPGKAGIRETASLGTGTGESQDKDFKDMMKAKATLIEGCFNKCLGRNGFEELFQFNEMDIEDKLKRSQIETNQINSGVRTINEVRKTYGWEPVIWGDTPVNMMNDPYTTDTNDGGVVMDDSLKRYENNLNRAKWLDYWSDNNGW